MIEMIFVNELIDCLLRFETFACVRGRVGHGLGTELVRSRYGVPICGGGERQRAAACFFTAKCGRHFRSGHRWYGIHSRTLGRRASARRPFLLLCQFVSYPLAVCV